MINDLFVSDIEVRLRSPEATYFLRLFRGERAAGRQATIALLNADLMRQYGAHLVVLERLDELEFAFLYAGAQVPDDAGAALGSKSTLNVAADTATLFRLGCSEAHTLNDAVSINHLSLTHASVHRWECLFLPMEDAKKSRMFVALCIPREFKHEFYRQLLDLAPEAALVALPLRDEANEVIDARLIYANRMACDLMGFEAGIEPGQTSISAIFPAPIGSNGWERNLAVLRTGKPQTFEFQHRTERSSNWFRVVSRPAKDGLVVFFQDITEQKRTLLELEHQKKMLIEEMEQRRSLEQELWSLAHLDPLTALPNRRAFRDTARLKLAEAQTAHRPCAMVSLDIDHFKHVNDAYGHAAGDTVLRRVADIIRAPLRPNTDIAARMGGEEFSIVLPDTDIDAAIAFAEKLRKRIEQTVVVVGEHEIRPTVSLGVAMNRKSCDLDDLLDRSDRALYTAKRSGRNKVATEIEGATGASSAPGAVAAA